MGMPLRLGGVVRTRGLCHSHGCKATARRHLGPGRVVPVRSLIGSDTSSSHPSHPPTTTISLTRQAWVGEGWCTCFKSALRASAS